MNSIHQLALTTGVDEIATNITSFFQPRNRNFAVCDPSLENCGPLRFDTAVSVNPTTGNTYHEGFPVPELLMLTSSAMQLLGSAILFGDLVYWVAPTWETLTYIV